MKVTKHHLDTCRADFEHYVAGTIKEPAREEFLRVGSSHWLDFKAGWLYRHQNITEK